MELGDKVKAATDALGVEPCTDCKKRQELLNRWGRRGFIGALTAAGTYAVLSVKLKAQSVFVLPDSNEALQLLRAIGTIQTVARDSGNGYVSKSDIIKRLLETQHGHAHEEGSTGEWARSLNLESDEIMPGWRWDYASKADGFVVIVEAIAESEDLLRQVYILDQGMIAHRADARGKIPSARSLARASDFPGAEPYDAFVGEERKTWLSRVFLRLGGPISVVKAAGRCANNTACCLCCTSNGGSCGSSHGGCFFSCLSTDCTYCEMGTGSFCCCLGGTHNKGCCGAACACGAGGVCGNCKCCVCTNSC